MSDQEKAVCAFALRAIAARGGPTLALEPVRPDEEERNRAAIDFIASNRSERWAVEHTRLESYRNQTKESADLAAFFDRVQERVQGRLPTFGSTHYEPFPIPRFRSRLTEIADQLAEALVHIAPSVDVDPFGERVFPLHLDPPTAPFRVTLWRESGLPNGGLVLRKSINHDDRPADQAEVVHKALADKTPKLNAAGLDASLLVFETNDIQLANAWQIADSVMAHTGDFVMPTHIELVTAFPEPGISSCIKRGDLWYSQIPDRLYFG